MLKDVITSILTLKGAVVEPFEKDAIEVLAPPELQKNLSIPELCMMGFGQEIPDGGLCVTLESDWMEKFEDLLGSQGRQLVYRHSPEDSNKWPEDVDKIVRQVVHFNNATFRVMDAEITETIYSMVNVRFTAISDEKREDILHICFNESNGMINDNLVEPILLFLRDAVKKNDPDEINIFSDSQEVGDICRLAGKALPGKLRSKIRPFLSSMERRMGKDIGRLHAYYTRLQDEVVNKISERINKGEQEENFEKERLRIESIRREYFAKVADLQRKYSMSIDVEFVQVLKMHMEVYRLHFKAMRRKGVRNFHLDWNPLTRRLEKITCEGCLTTPESVLICDEKLHFLCGNCLAPCQSCEKVFCRVCYSDKCNRCGETV